MNQLDEFPQNIISFRINRNSTQICADIILVLIPLELTLKGRNAFIQNYFMHESFEELS